MYINDVIRCCIVKRILKEEKKLNTKIPGFRAKIYRNGLAKAGFWMKAVSESILRNAMRSLLSCSDKGKDRMLGSTLGAGWPPEL